MFVSSMVDFPNPRLLGSEGFRGRNSKENPQSDFEGALTRRDWAAEAKIMDIQQNQQNMSNIINEFILQRVYTQNAQHIPPKFVHKSFVASW